MGATPGYNKLRRLEINKSKEINCDRCPYNKIENAWGKRRPRDDRYKNHRRN